MIREIDDDEENEDDNKKSQSHENNQVDQNNLRHISQIINIANSSNKPLKEKRNITLNMSKEENEYFSYLYDIAEKDKTGKIVGKSFATFLKKSSLAKDVLKNIWMIGSQSNPITLERDEFFIILRLVALAQNNKPVTIEAIINNTSIPPLPVFKPKKEEYPKEYDSDKVYVINAKSMEMYTKFFNINKEYSNKISIPKSKETWKNTHIKDDTLVKLIDIVKPLEEIGFLNLKEFIVCTHLVFKSFNHDIPKVLPKSLYTYLFEQKEIEIKQSNIQPIIQPKSPIQETIPLIQKVQTPVIAIKPMIIQFSKQISIEINSIKPIPIFKPKMIDDETQTEDIIILETNELEEITRIIQAINDINKKNSDYRNLIKESKEEITLQTFTMSQMISESSKLFNEMIAIQEELDECKKSFLDMVNERKQLENEYQKDQKRLIKKHKKRENIIKAKEEEEKHNAYKQNIIQSLFDDSIIQEDILISQRNILGQAPIKQDILPIKALSQKQQINELSNLVLSPISSVISKPLDFNTNIFPMNNQSPIKNNGDSIITQHINHQYNQINYLNPSPQFNTQTNINQQFKKNLELQTMNNPIINTTPTKSPNDISTHPLMQTYNQPYPITNNQLDLDPSNTSFGFNFDDHGKDLKIPNAFQDFILKEGNKNNATKYDNDLWNF